MSRPGGCTDAFGESRGLVVGEIRPTVLESCTIVFGGRASHLR